MKITLIIIGVIAIGCFALEIASKISATATNLLSRVAHYILHFSHHFLGLRIRREYGMICINLA